MQFIARSFRSMVNEYGIKLHLNANFHIQLNAVKRVNRVLKTAIRTYLNERDYRVWGLEVHKIGFSLKMVIYEMAGVAPTFLNFS